MTLSTSSNAEPLVSAPAAGGGSEAAIQGLRIRDAVADVVAALGGTYEEGLNLVAGALIGLEEALTALGFEDEVDVRLYALEARFGGLHAARVAAKGMLR
jgi:hypothetical protein